MQTILTAENIEWINTQAGKLDLTKPPAFGNKIESLWQFFLEAEVQLKHFLQTKDPAGVDDHVKYGLVLHTLHHRITPANKAKFENIGLPPSILDKNFPDAFNCNQLTEAGIQKKAKVAEDGSLLINAPFAGLDPNWVVSGIAYLFRQIGIISNHPFATKPAVIAPFEKYDSITIAVMGDWGTGTWEDGKYDPPAKLVATAISEIRDKPDMVIHLGDVYYAGRDKEEKAHLLNGFPVAANDFNFTLNSNHEVYNGSNGYFEIALKNSLFRFQQGTSYFAVKFKNWWVIGLDTAYFDDSLMIGKGALSGQEHNTIQPDFVRSLNIGTGERVILLTHHHALDYTGTIVNEPLLTQVLDAFGDSGPDYWYYGHIHIGAVFSRNLSLPKPMQLRCVGHSAIPVGQAALTGNPAIEYFVTAALPPTIPEQAGRVLNGFATITLAENSITERMFEVSPVSGVIKAWEFTHMEP